MIHYNIKWRRGYEIVLTEMDFENMRMEVDHHCPDQQMVDLAKGYAARKWKNPQAIPDQFTVTATYITSDVERVLYQRNEKGPRLVTKLHTDQ